MLPLSPPQTLEALVVAYDRERENLIPMLQDIQEHHHYLSPEAVQLVAAHLELSENDVYGVATFYAQFRFHPPGRHHVKVCQGTACHVRGSDLIMEAITRSTGIQPGETSADGNLSLERVACFGSCALAPVVVMDEKVFGRMTSTRTHQLLEEQQ